MTKKLDSNNLNVFDLDGTLISVDSFVEITKSMSLALFKKYDLKRFLFLASCCVMRKLNLISHLNLKRKVVTVFEQAFNENEKRELVTDVFTNNIIESVYDKMLKSENCIISTASPFSFISRMNFGKEIAMISSLMPDTGYPSCLNLSESKVENMRYYFGDNNFRIVNFYTDSELDRPLIDMSLNAFMCNEHGDMNKIK